MTGLLASRVCAEPQHYSIQPNGASRFELHVFKTGLYRGKVHTFLFPSYTGTSIYDAQRPEASKIELTLAKRLIRQNVIQSDLALVHEFVEIVY